MSSETLRPIRVWIFGSDARCDVVISQPEVSPRHCLLAQYENGYAVEDLGSDRGTSLNGRPLLPRQPEWVKREDLILLGGTVRIPWPGNGNSRTAGVESGSAIQRTVTIGRAPDSTVVLDYPMISWNHARLTVQAGGALILEDLGSTNGVAVGHPGNRIGRAE